MKLTPSQYAQALYDAIQQTNPKDHETVLDNFVKVLAQNGDLAKHAEIEQEYQTLDLRGQGIKQASFVTAREMEVNKPILDHLNKIVGSKTNVNKKVDDQLVGGVLVKVEDTLIDASIKSQLANLNRELKS